MTDKTTPCHFWDSTSGAGRNPNHRCQGDATGFVRKSHDNRLCPLCDACKGTFKQAQETMYPKVKESIPGHGSFSDVELTEESITEFKNQAPKTKSA